jgi:hypothetical protein
VRLAAGGALKARSDRSEGHELHLIELVLTQADNEAASIDVERTRFLGHGQKKGGR